MNLVFLFKIAFSLNLIVLAIFDFRWKILPLEWMIASTILFGFGSWYLGLITVSSLALGFLVVFGFLGLQVVWSKGRWMGSGDPWLGGMIGAVLGWPSILLSLYLTYFAGLLAVVPLLLLGRVTRKTRIPFAPFLAFGGVLTVWLSPSIIDVVKLYY